MHFFSGQFGSSVYDPGGENKDLDILVVPLTDESAIPNSYKLHRKFPDGTEVLRALNSSGKPFIDVVRVYKNTLENFLENPATVALQTRNAINSVLLYGIINEGMETVQRELKSKLGPNYSRKLLKTYLVDQEMTDIDGFPEKHTPHEAGKRLFRYSWIIKKWDTYELLKTKRTKLTKFEMQKILRGLLEASINRLHLDGLDYL